MKSYRLKAKNNAHKAMVTHCTISVTYVKAFHGIEETERPQIPTAHRRQIRTHSRISPPKITSLRLYLYTARNEIKKTMTANAHGFTPSASPAPIMAHTVIWLNMASCWARACSCAEAESLSGAGAAAVSETLSSETAALGAAGVSSGLSCAASSCAAGDRICFRQRGDGAFLGVLVGGLLLLRSLLLGQDLFQHFFTAVDGTGISLQDFIADNHGRNTHGGHSARFHGLDKHQISLSLGDVIMDNVHLPFVAGGEVFL